MKRSDSGDFCMLYIEPEDDRAGVFAMFDAISRQQGSAKPVVILLPVTGKTRAFAHPEDFSDLKHVKRQYGLLILFVIASNEHLRHLAARCGFPAYDSIDALSNALFQGQLTFAHQRAMARLVSPPAPAPPKPLFPAVQPERRASGKTTVPLSPGARLSQSEQAQKSEEPTPPAPSPLALQRLPDMPRVTPAAREAAPADAPTPHYIPPTSPAPAAAKRRGSRGMLAALIVLSLIMLGGGGGLGYYFLYAHAALPAPVAAPQSVGRLYFLSSEQVSDTSNQGLSDEVQVDLHDLQPPAPGNSFYAWLLSDISQGDTTVVYLGRLTVSQGSAHLFYGGDVQHTNLLAVTSRFLVTEESAAITPIAPSPDYSTWRYYGIIPQTPNPQDAQHFSLLDHLRHLLASDPLLNELELPGGLSNWFYRNTGKLLEWTGSARDDWQQAKNLAFERRQALRVLAYLDGLSFVQQDLPAGTGLPVIPNLASVGLIDVQGPNQQPPSFLTHILHHLNGLINAPGAASEQRKAAAQIIEAMSNVQQWFSRLRSDAKQFVAMSDAQLAQPAAFSLLDDMVGLANAAYTGQTDAATGMMREGVIWIHAQVQALANMDVYQYVQNVQTPEIVPTMQTSAS
jgi:hypothetical protein